MNARLSQVSTAVKTLTLILTLIDQYKRMTGQCIEIVLKRFLRYRDYEARCSYKLCSYKKKSLSGVHTYICRRAVYVLED